MTVEREYERRCVWWGLSFGSRTAQKRKAYKYGLVKYSSNDAESTAPEESTILHKEVGK